MAWGTTGRNLPADWKRRVAAVKARAGGRCQWIQADGSRCPDPGTDCDHIADPHDHALTNLQWLCAWHHQHKTAAQSAAARQANSQARAQAARLAHPGLTT